MSSESLGDEMNAVSQWQQFHVGDPWNTKDWGNLDVFQEKKNKLHTNTTYMIKLKTLYTKAMEAALLAGANRRALAAQHVLATPVGPGQALKRPLTKSSPVATISTTASPATVTPEAKRLMTESDKKHTVSTDVVPEDVDPNAPTLPGLELFPDDPMLSPGRSGMGWYILYICIQHRA